MQQDYQEINLIDYIKTIVRRKRLIGKITLATVIITAVFLFSWTNRAPLYETSGDITIGQVDGGLLETKDQIKTILNTEKTAKEILEQIDPDGKYTKTRLQTVLKNLTINGTTSNPALNKEESPENFLSISFKDANPEQTVQVTKILLDKIIKRHQKLFDEKQKMSAAILTQKQTELKRANENLKSIDNKLAQLFSLRYPSGYAIAQGYASTSYIETHNKLRDQVNALEEDILTKTHLQEQSEMSAIISPPLTPTEQSSTLPKTLALLIVALILGAFLGTISAFIAEWWKQNKNQITV